MPTRTTPSASSRPGPWPFATGAAGSWPQPAASASPSRACPTTAPQPAPRAGATACSTCPPPPWPWCCRKTPPPPHFRPGMVEDPALAALLARTHRLLLDPGAGGPGQGNPASGPAGRLGRPPRRRPSRSPGRGRGTPGRACGPRHAGRGVRGKHRSGQAGRSDRTFPLASGPGRGPAYRAAAPRPSARIPLPGGPGPAGRPRTVGRHRRCRGALPTKATSPGPFAPGSACPPGPTARLFKTPPPPTASLRHPFVPEASHVVSFQGDQRPGRRHDPGRVVGRRRPHPHRRPAAALCVPAPLRPGHGGARPAGHTP